MCATKTYFPAGKKPKVKAGTITCVNALYEIKRFNFSIIVPPFIRIYAISLAGALSRNRTSDTRIFSPLLYRLSYQGITIKKSYWKNPIGRIASWYHLISFCNVYKISLSFLRFCPTSLNN